MNIISFMSHVYTQIINLLFPVKEIPFDHYDSYGTSDYSNTVYNTHS